MNERIVNLTPHAINIRMDDGYRIIPPSGAVARVSTKSVPSGAVDGVPTVKIVFGEVVGLPDPQEGVTYIASSMVARAAQRTDVMSPMLGLMTIGDEAKQIVAVRGFQRFI